MRIEDAVMEALSKVEDPEIHRPITELGMVKSVSVESGHARIGVYLTIGACPMRDSIQRRVTDAVAAVEGIETVEVELDVMSEQQREQLKHKLRGPVKQIPFADPASGTRVYAVTSGKGGVGKSSVTVNLAVAFAQQGLKVGILDADIYGHSIPTMLGITAPITKLDNDLLLPPERHGVKALSILPFKPGGAAEPVAYRGPMLHKIVEQFLTDFYWGDLDVLLLDLPPGTGDVAMSVGSLLPNSQLLIVTTPQPAAAEVAVRAGMMAKSTRQRVAGVVENMSAVSCPHCGEPIDLFGSGGGDGVAEHLTDTIGQQVSVLARIPFDARLREGGDYGKPIVLEHPESEAAQAITALAAELARKPRGLSGISLKVSPR